ncbi:uncharacterized protein LOC144148774 [Haemaphysalis longicornis]
MNMTRALGTLCVVLALAIGDAHGCTQTEVEKCGLDFLPFYGAPRLAETAEDLQDHCKLFKGQMQCIENFANKCLNGLPKGIITLMIEGAADEYKGLCNTTTAVHKEYLDSVKCINNAGPEVQTCMQDFFVALHRAATAPVNQQIGYICCYHADFMECGEKALTSKCNLPAAMKFFNAIMDKVIGEGLSLACTKYKKGSGACEALPALSTENDSNARGKGFIGPVITITGNLG